MSGQAPQPCLWCNMLVDQDVEGAVYATHPAIREPWKCPASNDGRHYLSGSVTWLTGDEIHIAVISAADLWREYGDDRNDVLSERQKTVLDKLLRYLEEE